MPKKQAPAQEPAKKPLRRHEIVKAEAWAEVMAKYDKATDAERKKLKKEVTYDVSVTDLRDMVIGLIHERFGHGEQAYYRLEELGVCHHSTPHKWDMNQVQNPRLSKLRQVALACGKDIGLIDAVFPSKKR